MGSERWIQGSLFGSTAPARTDGTDRESTRRRLSYARVTRDPDAALSYAESRLIAAQVTHGLAAAFGRLGPERQAALRALFARPPHLGRTA